MPQLTNERNKTMVAGATAGVAEALATMPFEVTKNRIQMGEHSDGAGGRVQSAYFLLA